MAFDERLTQKVRDLLSTEDRISEKKMFGGIAFLLNKKMCCGVDGNELIVRVDPTKHDSYVRLKNVREFDLSGKKSIHGWIIVTPEGLNSKSKLQKWIFTSLAFVKTLKIKSKRKRSRKMRKK